MREELSRHGSYNEALEAKSKHDVQDSLQIRRTHIGFKVVRRTPPSMKEVQGPGKKRARRARITYT